MILKRKALNSLSRKNRQSSSDRLPARPPAREIVWSSDQLAYSPWRQVT